MKETRKHTGKIIKQFKNALFEVYLTETNILGVEATQEMKYDKDDVKTILDNIIYLAKDKKYLVLVNAGPRLSITYDALKLLVRSDETHYAYAKAYVIHTLPQKLIAGFYLRFFRPKVPVRFFKDHREAEAWLLRNFRHLYKK